MHRYDGLVVSKFSTVDCWGNYKGKLTFDEKMTKVMFKLHLCKPNDSEPLHPNS